MSFENRDYYRDTSTYGGMGRMTNTSMVTWILIITVVMYLLQTIMGDAMRMSWLNPTEWGNFNFDQGLKGGQVWRLITYQFLHAGFLHILFNMLMLYWFGPTMERWLGSKRFLAFYLLCGAAGAVMMTVLSMIPNLLELGGATQLVGASGAITGIIIGVAMISPPEQMIRLLIPPIPIKLRTLAWFIVGMSVFTIIVGGANSGGEAAHLGGAAFGFVLLKFPWLLGWANRISFGSVSEKGREARHAYKQQKNENFDAEVDRILDKVREHGLHSLTKKEKKVLQQATNDKRKNVG
ncbi:rhomboid family intramembrane serine protease [Planctomycetota bacterium]|nr:rhomboid family intramembrane serine protease [Planctomycetota bacterium]